MNANTVTTAGHDSTFGADLFSVTDPETPVWNGLVQEYCERLAADERSAAVTSDDHQAAGQQQDKRADDAGPAWPLDENATFHGVSHL